MTHRTIMAAIAAVITLGTVAGCSGSDPESQTGAGAPDGAAGATTTLAIDRDPDPADADDADDAEGKEPRAKPARERVSVDDFVARMRAGYQPVRTAHIEMRVEGLQPMTVVGDMRMSKTDQAMDMTIRSAEVGGEARLILVDELVYFGLSNLPPGTFVVADPNDARDQLGAIAAGLLADISIEDSFDVFEDTLRSVHYRGQETIDGRTLDRYTITLDAERALRSQDEPIPAGLPDTFEYGIWFDGKDRATRMTFDLLGTSMVTEMSGWNEPVAIKAPPPSRLVNRP